MEFSRIGARDIKFSGLESRQITNANRCFCPTCGAGPMDGVTGVRLVTEDYHADSPIMPAPEDASLCCYCGTFVSFQEEPDGQLSLRIMNRADYVRAKSDPDKWNALSKMKEIVDFLIDKAKITGDKKYAGKTKKFII